MHRLRGSVRHYPWGDPEAIPRLLGVPPDGRPWAELWFGTHPSAPSEIELDGRWVPLERLAGRLPVMVKVLAAAAPLSLQLHPDADHAARGYAREQSAGLPIDDPRRSYPDPFAKPELLCALTPFEALCGAAPPDDVDALLTSLGSPATPLLARHRAGGLGEALAWLLNERPDPAPLAEACRAVSEVRATWTSRLAELYPGDPAALATLLLNHVSLAPSEAIFVSPGTLHAYLRGTAIEVMGPSDNVVRCGLTSKSIDPDEVLRLLDPRPLVDPVIRSASEYASPIAGVRVRRIDLDGAISSTAAGAEIWLCTMGDAGSLRRGEAVYVAPGERVELLGRAELYRVASAAA